jgi:dynein assembly factor 2
MSIKDWEKLDITRDEVNRIGEALKNQEFRKLFADYCEEISNPENKKKYEEELTQLENERGIDISFIHPNPGYVIKTSADGKTKTFINVASNEKIGKPTSQVEIQNGKRGLCWSIPYSLAPPRPDQDNKGR